MTLHSFWMIVKNHFTKVYRHLKINIKKYTLNSGLKVSNDKTKVVWIVAEKVIGAFFKGYEILMGPWYFNSPTY